MSTTLSFDTNAPPAATPAATTAPPAASTPPVVLTPEPLMQLSDVSVGYRHHPVIESLSLSIQAGSVYAVIGPNGCGKTTLMRAMSRNMKPSSGSILLEGKDIFTMSSKAVARSVAALTQSHNTLSDVSVRTLVQYGRYAHQDWWRGRSTTDEDIVDWAIERTGLAGFESRKISALSGGEQQRAWIAMAIAQRPKLLLLDEPTTYLDICHQMEIMDLVCSLNREDGITIVMILHEINHAARYADRIVVLFDRRVYMEGRPWEVLERDVLERVFRIDARVISDADSDTPVLYAKSVIPQSE